MNAVFVELPPFERHRHDYLTDGEFQALQRSLMANPTVGDVIEGTGGLRKLRWGDPRRGKGKRGGLRIIYYWWVTGEQCWLFSLYNKDEASDLTPTQRKSLKQLLQREQNLRFH